MITTKPANKYLFTPPEEVATINKNAYMAPARRATSGTFDNARTFCRETYHRGILTQSISALLVLAHPELFPRWRTYANAPEHIINANGKQQKETQ